jgi:hypothetical protein
MAENEHTSILGAPPQQRRDRERARRKRVALLQCRWYREIGSWALSHLDGRERAYIDTILAHHHNNAVIMSPEKTRGPPSVSVVSGNWILGSESS